MSSELSPANTNDSESNVITVVVADDHPVVRKALRYELERERSIFRSWLRLVTEKKPARVLVFVKR